MSASQAPTQRRLRPRELTLAQPRRPTCRNDHAMAGKPEPSLGIQDETAQLT